MIAEYITQRRKDAKKFSKLTEYISSLAPWRLGMKDLGTKLTRPCVITIIGSGGKTSIIWRLASVLKNTSLSPKRKILVTPTTKMFVPPEDTNLYDWYCGSGELPASPAPGVTLAGVFNNANCKLEALPSGELEKSAAGFDLVLIEGDGARGLPFKAWADHEPVVPAFTDLTIGVLPICRLGEPVSEKIIHRLPLFIALTGAKAGEALTMEHLRLLVTGRSSGSAAPLPGLFAKARGRKILFLNQVEDDNALEKAKELAASLTEEFRLTLDLIIAGSMREDRVAEL